MKIKPFYDKQEDIPENFADLYSEKGGKWVLTGIDGIEDAGAVSSALSKERSDRKKLEGEKKALESKLAAFGDLTPEAANAAVEKVTELEAAVETMKGATNEEAIQKRVDAAVRSKLGPVERERDTARRERDEALATNKTLSDNITTGQVNASVTEAATKAKVMGTAIADVIRRAREELHVVDGQVVTKDIPGRKAGLDPSAWLSEIAGDTPHWYESSQGGGGRGSRTGRAVVGPDNPWSREGWNVTKQAKYQAEHGKEKAAAMAAAVGSSVDATRPPAPAAPRQ